MNATTFAVDLAKNANEAAACSSQSCDDLARRSFEN